MGNAKSSISCLANGPYLLKVDESAEVLLTRANGKSETIDGVALCRCGGSKNKPFCDGTHKSNGFSDKRISDGANDSRSSYLGDGITIHDNRGICAHAGVCTDNLNSVFRMFKEPWINPDGAPLDEIIDVVNRCPSGALGYSIDDVEQRPSAAQAEITLIENGPYRVCNIDLVDQDFGDGVSSAKYTLCRCGASKNKPFCDGSHWDAGFKDEA